MFYFQIISTPSLHHFLRYPQVLQEHVFLAHPFLIDLPTIKLLQLKLLSLSFFDPGDSANAHWFSCPSCLNLLD